MLLLLAAQFATDIAAGSESCNDHADDDGHRRRRAAAAADADDTYDTRTATARARRFLEASSASADPVADGGEHWTAETRLERRTATLGFALAVWAGGKVWVCSNHARVEIDDGGRASRRRIGVLEARRARW